MDNFNAHFNPQGKVKIIFYAPILEYPPKGGPQMSVTNAIKVLSQISELHIITNVAPETLTKEALSFFQSKCKNLSFAPTSKLYSANFLINKFLHRSKRTFDFLFLRFDVAFIEKYSKENNINLFWVDRVLEFSFAVMFGLRKKSPNAFIVGDTCSVYSRFILRELEVETNFLRRLWISYKGKKKEAQEKILTTQCDVVTAVSELDAQYFRVISPRKDNIFLFSNIVDLEDFKHVPTDLVLKGPSVVLLGSYGHKNSPMDRAAAWLIDDIAPMVRKEIPDAHFYIVGRNSEKTLKHREGKGIIVTGSVRSVLPYLQSAKASLVPLRFESGTRFKILETGAAQICCISTTLGAEGIDITHNKNIIIADSTKDFAEGIIRVMKDENLAKELGKNLYNLVDEKYSLKVQKEDGHKIISKYRMESV